MNITISVFETENTSGSIDHLTQEQKDSIVEKVLNFYIKHEAFDAETICQSDDCVIDAVEVLAEIVTMIKFEIQWKS